MNYNHFYKYGTLVKFKNTLCDVFLFLMSLSFCSTAFSSERLELYFLSERIVNTKTLSVQDAIQFNIKSRLLGFEGFSTSQKKIPTLTINRSIHPVIAYSNNINGGNLSQTIQVGDFTFVGEEDANAKSGLIVGGGVFFGLKKQYGRGKYVDIQLNSSLASSPAHDWLRVRNQSIIACSKNYLKEWMFFDACGRWVQNQRKYSNSISKSISLSLTRLFVFNQICIIS